MRLSFLAFFVCVTISAPAQESPDGKLLQRAREIDKRIIVFDSHVDLPFDYPGAVDDGKTQIDHPQAPTIAVRLWISAAYRQAGDALL